MTQPVGFVEFGPVPVADGGVHASGLALGGDLVDKPSRAMVTGTLALTSDGKFAVAADSERDQVVVVDLAARTLVVVDVQPGDEPGRTIVGRGDDAPHAYTVLRRSAAIVDVDVRSAALTRVPTCLTPRGLAYDEQTNRVHVACATGELITYDATTWESQRHVVVARDLRDVVVTSDGVLVSRFGSAELIHVDEDGAVTLATRPTLPPDCASSTVMHRLIARDGRLYAAQQLASDRLVLGRNGASDCEVAQVAATYWSASLDEVTALTEADVADFWREFATTTSVAPVLDGVVRSPNADHYLARLDGSAGPMDLAVGADGRVAVLVSGNHWVNDAWTIFTWDKSGKAEVALAGARAAGMISSLALDGDDKWVAQSREPSGLYFEDQPPIFFGGASVNNTGYSLFHMNSGDGVACASCHPEGGQDEHVWHLPRGARRTLSLDANYAAYSALNWSGSWSSLSTLMPNVFNQQMAHDWPASESQLNVLSGWLEALPNPSPGVIATPAAVERGRRLFAGSAGCDDCHVGADYTSRQFPDVGTGGNFKIPSLLGVGARSRLLHDGCAATLRDVFGACGGDQTHQIVERFTAQELDDIEAFLKTL